jgi:hypothetical protein
LIGRGKSCARRRRFVPDRFYELPFWSVNVLCGVIAEA